MWLPILSCTHEPTVKGDISLQMAKARGSDLAGVASKSQPGGASDGMILDSILKSSSK
jgi:hypothetical protein